MIPRTLSENAGQDATLVLSRLYSAHARGGLSQGVNIVDPECGLTTASAITSATTSNSTAAPATGDLTVDAVQARIYDLVAVKQNAMRLAVQAVLTVLSVDQIIMSKPAGGPKVKQPSKNFDED